MINLLVDAGDPTRKKTKYRLMFTGADGRDYTLVGFKDIIGKTFLSAWPETTTLYATILAGHVAASGAGETVASGVLTFARRTFSSASCSRSVCKDRHSRRVLRRSTASA